MSLRTIARTRRRMPRRVSLRTRMVVVIVSVLLADAAVAAGQERVDFFHALILRRPVMEQEVETQVRGASGGAGHEVGLTATLDARLARWWQIELTLPFLLREPSNEPSTAGIADIVLENKVLLVESFPRRTLVAAGLDVTVPSGDASRSLGGHAALTPFVTAGIGLGRVEVLTDLGFRWDFDGLDRGERQVTGGVAVGVPLGRWTPFIEATTGIELHRASTRVDKTLTATRGTVGPGLNVKLAPGRTLLFGVELPVAGPRLFDYEARVGLVWDF